MKETKEIHKIYKEWIASGKAFRQITGKYQYIFSSEKGKISCVEFLDYFHDGRDFWEIFAYDDLFEDVERYPTFEEAKARCEELLK